jgi:hypothetical protein
LLFANENVLREAIPDYLPNRLLRRDICVSYQISRRFGPRLELAAQSEDRLPTGPRSGFARGQEIIQKVFIHELRAPITFA